VRIKHDYTVFSDFNLKTYIPVIELKTFLSMAVLHRSETHYVPCVLTMDFPHKHAVMCQYRRRACTGPMLPASARYWQLMAWTSHCKGTTPYTLHAPADRYIDRL